MNIEIRSKFEEFEKRSSGLEKRFDDLKWYFGGVTTLFTIGLSVCGVILNWNYTSEKAALREFQRDLKVEVGKIALPSEIDLLTLTGIPLSGSDVPVTVTIDKDQQRYLELSHIVRNRGEGTSGSMFIKLYTSDPIVLGNVSTDEPKFKYEAYISAQKLDPHEIPGKFSAQYFDSFSMTNKAVLKRGRYPGLVKVYYGVGRVAQANVTLVMDDETSAK